MDKLGIQPSLLFAQVVNFSIIVVVLAKLLYKPILTALEKRKKEIEKGLALTEKLEQEEAKLNEKRERVLGEARNEALAIVEEAKKQGKSAEKEIVAQAHHEAQEIIARARTENEKLRSALEKDIRRQTVELASTMAKWLLSQTLTGEDKHTIIEKHLRELTSGKQEVT
jgi:F-type H+-transporting ATPase subunit b